MSFHRANQKITLHSSQIPHQYLILCLSYICVAIYLVEAHTVQHINNQTAKLQDNPWTPCDICSYKDNLCMGASRIHNTMIHRSKGETLFSQEVNGTLYRLFMDPCQPVNRSKELKNMNCPYDSALCMCDDANGECTAPAYYRSSYWEITTEKSFLQMFGFNKSINLSRSVLQAAPTDITIATEYVCNASREAAGIGLPLLVTTMEQCGGNESSFNCLESFAMNPEDTLRCCILWNTNYACPFFPSSVTSSFASGSNISVINLKAGTSSVIQLVTLDQYRQPFNLVKDYMLVIRSNCSSDFYSLNPFSPGSTAGQLTSKFSATWQEFPFEGIICNLNFSFALQNASAYRASETLSHSTKGNNPFLVDTPLPLDPSDFAYLYIVIFPAPLTPNPSGGSFTSVDLAIILCSVLAFVVVLFTARWYYKHRIGSPSTWRTGEIDEGRRGLLRLDGTYVTSGDYQKMPTNKR